MSHLFVLKDGEGQMCIGNSSKTYAGYLNKSFDRAIKEAKGIKPYLPRLKSEISVLPFDFLLGVPE